MLIQLPYVYHADLNDPYGYSQTGWDALAGAIEEGYWEKFEDLLFESLDDTLRASLRCPHIQPSEEF